MAASDQGPGRARDGRHSVSAFKGLKVLAQEKEETRDHSESSYWPSGPAEDNRQQVPLPT